MTRFDAGRESDRERRRAITQQLLLGALREHDAARDAADASARAQFLADASRALAMSLDECTTRDTIRHLALPRPGSWSIVDVVESNGELHRLAVAHPDPSREALGAMLQEQLPAETSMPARSYAAEEPRIVTLDSGAALVLAAHGEANLRILRQIGLGALLIVPLIVRARIQGSITFVIRDAEPLFSADEIALAVDLAARCAMALDNARLYREADALRVAAETANRSKSEFVGNMSHELRTPLNAIGGYVELLEMEIDGALNAGQQRSLARIRANQRHLLILITDILNFVRLAGGRLDFHRESMSLSRAVADVGDMLSDAIAKKGLVLSRPTSGAETVAWADPDRVRQILLNLIMNAVKYTPQGGGTISIAHSIDGDFAVASVTDTGVGMEPSQLQAIFEPFVQLAAGLSERRGGVGLGLSISRDLARAMGGDVTVESTVGVGSRFTLRLPRRESRV